MTQNLPDVSPVPRRKEILPEGVIRAKDNTNDYSFTSKPKQEEAEHNMGYYLAELNNRNHELEDLVERQDKDLKELRRENAELRERSMKTVTAAVPPALPDFSNASRIHQQRLLLEDKDNELNRLRNQVNHLNGEYSTVAQQRNEARELLRTSQAQLDLVRDESRMQRSRLDIVTNHRDAWRLAAVMFAIAFVGALILGG